jgi:hypothetical protein
MHNGSVSLDRLSSSRPIKPSGGDCEVAPSRRNSDHNNDHWAAQGSAESHISSGPIKLSEGVSNASESGIRGNLNKLCNKMLNVMRMSKPSDPTANLTNTDRSTVVVNAFKAVDLESLTGNRTSMKRTISLGASLNIKFDVASLAADPVSQTLVKTLGLSLSIQKGASIEGSIEVAGERLGNGNVKLSFTSSTKGTANVGVTASGGGILRSRNSDTETGTKNVISYTFLNNTEAANFLKSLGQENSFQPAPANSTEIGEGQYKMEKSPPETYVSSKISATKTKLVDSTSGTGKGLSTATLSYSNTLYPESPQKSTSVWGLDTIKAGLWRLAGLEIPTSSIMLTMERDVQDGQVVETANVGIELNLAKIFNNLPKKATDSHTQTDEGTVDMSSSGIQARKSEARVMHNQNIDDQSTPMDLNAPLTEHSNTHSEFEVEFGKLTAKITERLEAVLNKANDTPPKNRMETGNLREIVDARLKILFDSAQNSMEARGIERASITIDLVVAEVQGKFGDMLALSFPLAKNPETNRYEAVRQEKDVKITLNGVMGASVSVGFGDNLSVSASGTQETTTNIPVVHS